MESCLSFALHFHRIAQRGNSKHVNYLSTPFLKEEYIVSLSDDAHMCLSMDILLHSDLHPQKQDEGSTKEVA